LILMVARKRPSRSIKAKDAKIARKRVFFAVLILIGVLYFVGYKKSAELSSEYYARDAFLKPEGLPKGINPKIKIPIITYHYVEHIIDPEDTKRRSLTTSPYALEQSMKALNNAGYSTHFVREIPRILYDQVPYSTRSAFLTFDDGYDNFYSIVLPLLKKYNVKATLFVINNYVGRTGFVNKQELEEIRDSGLVEIAAHTMDHAYLKDAPKDYALREMAQSKKDLEQRLGIKVFSIAYPYGAFTAETAELAKKVPFAVAVSVIPGVMQSKDNLYYLSRLRSGVVGGSSIVQVLESINK